VEQWKLVGLITRRSLVRIQPPLPNLKPEFPQAKMEHIPEEVFAMASDGDTVRVHYTGTLADGTMFDTSREREPLEFIMGNGNMIPGFEEATRDMQVGQVKTVTIPAEKAYGPYHDEMVVAVPRDQLPTDLNPVIGQRLQMQSPDGMRVVVVVTNVSDTAITLDANHPLAGKDLTFEIELVEIK
jgi:peptidylprolyl isomerase